jgi:hypothetical protein
MPWCRAPLWDLRPDITSCRYVAVWNLRTGLQFAVQSLNGPNRAESVTILCCLIWDSSNLEGQVPLFISPRNRVIPPGIGFPLRRPLRLSGLWWRYSNPSPTWRAQLYKHLTPCWVKRKVTRRYAVKYCYETCIQWNYDRNGDEIYDTNLSNQPNS